MQASRWAQASSRKAGGHGEQLGWLPQFALPKEIH